MICALKPGVKTIADLHDKTNLQIMLQMDTSQLGFPSCMDPAEDCSVGMLLNLRYSLGCACHVHSALYGSQTSASLVK